MSKNLKLLKYAVFYPGKTSTSVLEFKGEDILKARKEATDFCKSIKNLNGSYEDIKLVLEFEKNNISEQIEILNGHKMGTNIILDSLNTEYEILKEAELEFDTMKTEDYFAINQNFTSMYYFTVD